MAIIHNKFRHRWRKAGEVYYNKVIGDEEEEEVSFCVGLVSRSCSVFGKRTTRRHKLFYYFAILVFFFWFSIFAPDQYFTPRPNSPNSLLHSYVVEDEVVFQEAAVINNASLCSNVSNTNGTMNCDRKSVLSDVCIMKGDVRTDSAASSVFLYTGDSTNGAINHDVRVLGLSDDDNVVDDEILQHEIIKPYTRKWESDVMSTVQELDLLMIKKGNSSNKSSNSCHCDVRHSVPALFFSTSGYTGNLFHEFNDGIVPLYITAQHLNKQVVFVIVDYKEWWPIRYGDIVRELSDYRVIDFTGDNRTHCFPEAIVGLRVHGDLSISPSLMEKAGNDKVTIGHFREFLKRAYWPRVQTLIQDDKREAKLRLRALARSLNHSSSSLALLAEMQAKDHKRKDSRKPKLVIMARINGSREIINQDALVEMAEKIGFSVEIVSPIDTTELAIVYRAVSSKDVMVGVHGAALTHFLFMQPGGVFIQIIPLGMDWLSHRYFGESTVKFGLKYIGYKISPEESSLYDNYDKNDPILVDPDNVIRRSGWEVQKQVYLAHQNVKLNLSRFQEHLLDAYNYVVSKKKRRHGRPRRHRSNSPSQ